MFHKVSTKFNENVCVLFYNFINDIYLYFAHASLEAGNTKTRNNLSSSAANTRTSTLLRMIEQLYHSAAVQ